MIEVDKILHLCARIEQQPEQHHLLVEACAGFSKWDKLLHRAEGQGMGPLLHKHLATVEGSWPDSFHRGLMLLSFRHRQANALLMKSLTCILRVLEVARVPVIVLKGAALCQTLYPNIGLRPMRDIDLLVSQEDVHYVHTILQKNGFHVYATVMPEDHFHLPPLYQNIDGVQVCVELHYDLFPSCPPYYQTVSFAELYKDAFAFDAGGVPGYMFATEEMLWHLYEHGFHAPLTYEPYKIISAADIIALVEKKVDEIDWRKLQSKYPQLFHALPFFHYLTPWSENVLKRIPPLGKYAPSGVGECFKGWPRVRLAAQKDKGLLGIVRHTFFPSQWWLMVYYAPGGLLSVLRCRIIQHPKHVLWWMKLYWNIFLEVNLPEASGHQTIRNNWLIPAPLKNARILIGAMCRKFR